MKYCKKCLMPDTRPGIRFLDGVCIACINYEKQKTIDWETRKKELEKLCDKYRGINGDGYDCAIAVSGGKDSHFQVYYMKEVMKMNPVLFSAGNIDSTEIGRKNLENLSDSFSCDIIMHLPNRDLLRKTLKIAFEEEGSPTWYIDSLLYSFPVRMSLKMGIELLVYGENVNYTYGGKDDEETYSALKQPFNNVVKPIHEKLIESGRITSKELDSNKFPTIEECKNGNLDPIYLSYFIPWDTQHNYQVAQRWGFRHLGHEYRREGTIEDYNSIDSLTFLLNQYMKYPKYGHASATEMASRWIRAGTKNREEMIPYVEEYDDKLDQGIVDGFCDFTKMTKNEFWRIMDKWYNTELFEQDNDGVWHKKFKIGQEII